MLSFVSMWLQILLKALEGDLRRVMQPNTAENLRVRVR